MSRIVKNIDIGVRGEYRATVLTADHEVIDQTDWSANTITDYGLQHMQDYPIFDSNLLLFGSVSFGSSNATSTTSMSSVQGKFTGQTGILFNNILRNFFDHTAVTGNDRYSFTTANTERIYYAIPEDDIPIYFSLSSRPFSSPVIEKIVLNTNLLSTTTPPTALLSLQERYIELLDQKRADIVQIENNLPPLVSVINGIPEYRYGEFNIFALSGASNNIQYKTVFFASPIQTVSDTPVVLREFAIHPLPRWDSIPIPNTTDFFTPTYTHKYAFARHTFSTPVSVPKNAYVVFEYRVLLKQASNWPSMGLRVLSAMDIDGTTVSYNITAINLRKHFIGGGIPGVPSRFELATLEYKPLGNLKYTESYPLAVSMGVSNQVLHKKLFYPQFQYTGNNGKYPNTTGNNEFINSSEETSFFEPITSYYDSINSFTYEYLLSTDKLSAAFNEIVVYNKSKDALFIDQYGPLDYSTNSMYAIRFPAKIPLVYNMQYSKRINAQLPTP